MAAITIQKQTNETVFFIQNGQILTALNRDCTMNLNDDYSGIFIIDKEARRFNLRLIDVADTQILPAAAVAFLGDLAALWTLLVQQFFNELHTSISGGGGVVENNILQVGANYSILTTNYIIEATASNINIRLPTIGADIGQVYRIYAPPIGQINVLCDDPSGDRINGKISVTMKKYEMATFRALSANNWRIGD